MSHSCCRSVTLTSAFSFLLFTSSYTCNVSSSQVFLWSQPALEPQHRPPTLSARGLASGTDLGLVGQRVIKKDSTPQQVTQCVCHIQTDPKTWPLTASSWPLTSNMQLDHKLLWLSQTSGRHCESQNAGSAFILVSAEVQPTKQIFSLSVLLQLPRVDRRWTTIFHKVWPAASASQLPVERRCQTRGPVSWNF